MNGKGDEGRRIAITSCFHSNPLKEAQGAHPRISYAVSKCISSLLGLPSMQNHFAGFLGFKDDSHENGSRFSSLLGISFDVSATMVLSKRCRVDRPAII